MSHINFYKNEKHVNPIFLILWVTTCFALLFILSYFYSFFSSIIPIVYFCVLVTVGFAVLIGYLVRFSSKIFVITNKKIIYTVSIICSLFTIYFSWLAYVLQLNSNAQEIYFLQPGVWIEFNNLASTISSINEVGLWGFFDANLTDWPLTLVWIAEIVLIILIPLALIRGYNISPHSSRLNKWYRKYELNKQFQTIVGISEANEKIALNTLDYINNLTTGEVNRHSLIQIYFLEEEGPQYLTAINYRLDKEGKITDKNVAILNQEIAKNDAKIIMEQYHAKKMFLLD